MLSGLLRNAEFFTDIGFGVGDYFNKDIRFANGSQGTVASGVERGRYGKVYLCIGINDLGWNPTEFIKHYVRIVEHVRRVLPNAILYVQSILPVTLEQDAKQNFVNNDNVFRFNDAIMQFCADYQLHYLDAAAALGDGYGRLPSDDSRDGTHLNSGALARLVDYYRRHAYVVSK